MDELVDEGITSFKLFMAYPGVFFSDDGQILRAMQTAARNGSMIMMHAENGTAIDVLVAQALARGETAPRYHSLTRPWETEEEATHRAIMLAHLTGAPLYVVHMSAKQAVSTLAAGAADEGWNVFGETCPQYLYLSLEEHLSQPGFEGAKWVCSTPCAPGGGPPGRAVALPAHRRPVGGQHRPLPVLLQGAEGARASATSPRSPTGSAASSTGWTCSTRASSTASISLSRWVELCCTTPARMFGLHPRKGEILPGADADIVVYDPDGRTARHLASTPTT